MIRKLYYFLSVIIIIVFITNCGSDKVAKIKISNVWSRAAVMLDDEIGGMGVVYLTISNSGLQADTLLSLDSKIARKIEIHKTEKIDGRVKMKPVKYGIEIQPGGQIDFTAGGTHIMLIGLEKNLKTGDSFELKLTFSSGAVVSANSKVK